MDTTLTSWAKLIWQTLSDDGIDARAAFLQAGLDPARLADASGRYPATGMRQLWTEAERCYSKPDFGLDVGARWQPTSFNALGFAWLASDTLYEALERLVRYAQLVNSGLHAKLSKEGAHYQLQIAPHAQSTDAAKVAGLAAIVTMCRSLLGDSFSPVALGIDLNGQPLSAEAQAFFSGNADTCAANNWIAIDCQQAHIHLPGANTQLALVNEKLALENLSKVQNSNIRARLGQAIAARLPSGEVSEAAIAVELGLSTRSLQRRLQDEGTHFKQLLDKIRRELAKEYLSLGEHSLSEISYLLGYGDQPSFSRAFKRWFDVSPSQYRNTTADEKIRGDAKQGQPGI
ncbi:AraC family transcriptional regulator ligand-binding domain-containing protein [Gilvimarinus sp. SDUM040013]|uniref:AraC family transcriptional regulator ligand-binding domain-containing protein n=1 Tax=Gilvimarinus gilvus TaxID=3058038 RepID=A0ABU4S233_9GAMM|nr:AraC family transcriptional regulator [Gilvimarinus sp. SDUM040013]MDO3385844.1 AraC family transcriptional regulator ligand-binding domain-containing protein [Gilvimarinus sp. SDUM040013]MDX6851137.1 AraC family transcriptional regulator ligand-binding domain-containing protein [Gilvimarinus sp. SDUM040013]